MVYQVNTLVDTIELRVPSSYDRNKMTNTITIDRLKLLSEGNLVQKGFNSYQLVSKGQSIRLSYTIPTFSDDTRQLSCDGDDYFIPAINTKFFHMYGDKSLVIPNFDISEEKRFDIELEWLDFPNEWHIASDYGIAKVENGTREKQYKEGLLQEDIGNSLFIGGTYRKNTFKVEDKNFHLYLFGKWKFEDELLIDMIKRITEAELKLWSHFYHNEEYVISVTQKGIDDCGRIGGRNMYDSFCFYLPGKFTENHFPLFTNALIHEFTHTWIGVDIVVNHPEPGIMKWFTEGFTDYYANRVGLEAGYVDKAQYIGQLNKFIETYKLSPYRSLSIQEYNKNYLFDERLENLAYHKGAVFAFYLDGYIREKSEGKLNLDHYMEALFSNASMAKMNRNLNFTFVNSIAEQALGLNISDLLEKYIVEGEIIPIASPLIESYDTKEKIAFEYGFDYITSIEKEVISSVIENSNAYKAGLRNGQKFLAINGMTSDPNGKMIFVVSDEKGKHTIEYSPKGPKIVIPVITKLKGKD